MRLVADIASHVDFDPARPSVPEFGRNLYHLDSRRFLSLSDMDASLARKIAAARLHFTNDDATRRVRNAQASWFENIESVCFGGVVLDYDGTVCDTARRFDVPSSAIQEALLKLLRRGTLIGFATGRGRSLTGELTKWLPEEFYDQVHVGVYNGSIAGTLNEFLNPEFIAARNFNGPFLQPGPEAFAHSLEYQLEPFDCVVTTRPWQVTIEPRGETVGQWGALQLRVEELVSSQNLTSFERLKVVSSGHSMDIIGADVSKAQVATAMEVRSQADVLAVGDQGNWGGNDFELLAARTWTMSVDRVSADPSRCWRIGPVGLSGSDLLKKYLSSLHFDRKRNLRFRWVGRGG